ncbi:MAG: hypothetical protein AB7Q29_15955 [Vicinamibacterales bacterium]
MITSATDFASRNAQQVVGASGAYSFLTCAKRTSGVTTLAVIADLLDDADDHHGAFQITAADRLAGHFSGYGGAADWGPNPWALNTWYWLYFRATGADAFATYWMLGNGTSWTNGLTVSGNGFADKVLNDLILGQQRNTGGGTNPLLGIIGPTKIWDIDIAAATILSNNEHVYRNIQANAANGRLAWKAEDSGVGGVVSAVDQTSTGNLTIASSAQYSSDEPASILGDDPGGGGSTPGSIVRGLTSSPLTRSPIVNAMRRVGNLFVPDNRIIRPRYVPGFAF